MKKQILLLAMVTMALLFAGTNNVFGQISYIDYVQGTPVSVGAVPLTCTTAATTAPELNPTPGVTYNYSISTDPNNVASVHWFVTDQNNIISVVGTAAQLQPDRDPDGGTGDYILDAENGIYDVAANTQKDIDISWKNFDGTANEVVLVAYVSGANGCSDNIQIWRIQPVFNFTIDVLSMFDNGSLGTAAQPAFECVSPIESATYDGTNLAVNYGQNYIFFSVTAANFVHSWQPTITAAAVGGGTVGTINWAYTADAGSTAAAGWHAITDPVLASAAAPNGVVGTSGESIVVRVQIVNNNEPPVGATPSTVTLSIDGVMYDPANATNHYANTTLQDMDNAGAGQPCVNNHTDTADYNITGRPDIAEVNPTTAAGPFEPKN